MTLPLNMTFPSVIHDSPLELKNRFLTGENLMTIFNVTITDQTHAIRLVKNEFKRYNIRLRKYNKIIDHVTMACARYAKPTAGYDRCR